MSERLSRRAFLGLAGGAVLLAACGDDDTGASLPTHPHFSELAPGVLSSDLYVSDEPQRFAFAALAKEGYASIGPARLAVAPPGQEPRDFVGTTLRTDGLPERRGVYLAELLLPSAGVWSGLADFDGTTSEFVFRVNERPEAPVAGDEAPRAASPTTAETLDVDPICTREPVCPLHERSLDTLLGAGRPVAVLFATPARCASEYCGPVLDTMLPLVDEHPGVDFVHVEIYENLRTDDLVPTVASWNLPSEPWFFAIDADGAVVARLDGAFSASEMEHALEALARPT